MELQPVPTEEPEEDKGLGPALHLTIKTLTGQSIPITIHDENADVNSVAIDIHDDNEKLLGADGKDSAADAAAETIRQHIANTTDVLRVKMLVQDAKDIPPSFQRLIYHGRELKDGDMLSTYSIKEGSTIHMVLKRNAAPQADATGAAADTGGQVLLPNMGVGGGGGGGGANIDYTRLTLVQRLSAVVKIFAFIDTIFTMMFASQYPICFIGVVLCVCGYYGAHQYKQRFIAAYVLYTVLSILVRLYLIYSSDNSSLILLIGFGVIIECFIFNITFRYFKLVSQLTQEERAELQNSRTRMQLV